MCVHVVVLVVVLCVGVFPLYSWWRCCTYGVCFSNSPQLCPSSLAVRVVTVSRISLTVSHTVDVFSVCVFMSVSSFTFGSKIKPLFVSNQHNVTEDVHWYFELCMKARVRLWSSLFQNHAKTFNSVWHTSLLFFLLPLRSYHSSVVTTDVMSIVIFPWMQACNKMNELN